MKPGTVYRSRVAAGRELASYLGSFAGMHPIIFGASEGGDIVAREVGKALDAPVLVRTNGARPAEAAGTVDGPDLRERMVLVVDDALLDAAAMRDAVTFVRSRGARRIVVSAPIACESAVDAMRPFADEVVCPRRESGLRAAADCYDVNDESGAGYEPGPPSSRPSARVLDIRIPAGASWLDGTLVVPPEPRGMVLFAHGGHSTRDSTRDRYVAGELQGAGFATLMFDLLTREEQTRDARASEAHDNGALRAERLLMATHWVVAQPSSTALPLGYFGASAGAATALVAAASSPDVVRAVVAPGAVFDDPPQVLARVQAPTLLLVGERDTRGIELCRHAMTHLNGRSKMQTVADAGHCFDEPGALEVVAAAAANWFARHLERRAASASEGALEGRA